MTKRGMLGPMRAGERTRRLLFVHGAGGYVEDRPLADALGVAVDADLVMPHLPDQDMSAAAWSAALRAEMGRLGRHDLMVGHSFGASILLGVLREPEWPPGRRVAWLAMPDWGPDGWDIPDYVLGGPQPHHLISLHHCRDDHVVPYSHLALNTSRLPTAQPLPHATGGHQFEGRVDEVATWLTNR